ncbi:unnamed protein product [Paramecium sonneborni]|uniref:Uncharacterized protein n=1 Tax=Paramecium sonneborni TaxID=65129 RepID=A0A8S1KUR3_9CILI|nr:unnamed protein product [Paramecium sonneborni]
MKHRSRSLTHRLKQSQINSHQIINQQHITNINNNIEISLSQQGMQLQIMNQKRKNFNKVLNFILQQKNNNSNTHNFGTNTNIANSQNDSQNQISERYKINYYKKIKQFDFESQIPEGPLLSFRQFAKIQGLKIPQILE